MSEHQQSFMTLALNGDVLPSEIDDFIDDWHDSDSELEIYQYLEMTPREYSFWVSNPDQIDIIIAARHRRQNLLEAVNDNVASLDRLAARSGDPRDVKKLKRWIQEQDHHGFGD